MSPDGDDENHCLDDSKLGEDEAELIRLVKAAEVDAVLDHLREHEDIDVNVRDFRGRTPLVAAIRTEHGDIIDALLRNKQIELGDALLHAVNEGNTEILETLLNHEERHVSSTTQSPPFESFDFASHMTPLMLACHENNYEMVQLLISHGHRLPPGNLTDCAVGDKVCGETLESGRARMDLYKATASPVYMVFFSPDPLLLAFQYAHAADKLSYKDPIFNEDYRTLSDQCREIGVQMLEQCRTSEEVRLLLAQPHDLTDSSATDCGGYPRLFLAISYEMKEFIAHKNCQQVLQNIWTRFHPNIMWMTFTWRILYFLPQVFLLPFVYIAYFFMPCAPFLQYWHAPMNKFMGDVVSYFTFLGVLLYGILPNNVIGERVPGLNNGVDVAIWVFVLGFLWDHAKLTYCHGFKAYTKDWWNVYSAVMTMMFFTSFGARLASVITSWSRGATYRDVERSRWPSTDPMLVSECFHCLAVIMAFGRLLWLFTISQILGPLQLSLSNMFTDVMQIMAIIGITLLAFTMGMFRMYHYYTGAKNFVNGELKDTQSDLFSSLKSTFLTLFWDLFGYGTRTDTALVVNNACPNQTEACFPSNQHDLTEGIGFFTYCLYHMVVVTAMINMLIAMMGNTFSRIQENADVEWKFARSRVWMSYLEKSSLLPTPINIVPTPYDIYNFVRWIISCRGGDGKWNRQMCCYVLDPEELERQKDDVVKYKKLIVSLKKRYLSKLEDDEGNQSVRPEDLEEVKNDIKDLSREARGKRQRLSLLP